MDCKDESDESSEHCFQSKCSERRCTNGACIEESKFCDRIQDCLDGSDELASSCGNDTETPGLLKIMYVGVVSEYIY